MEDTHESDYLIPEKENEERHVLKWYPLFQYFVIGALFSCLDLTHVKDQLKPTNATTNIATEVLHTIEEQTGMPQWALVTVLLAVAVLILGICFCCVRRCFRKRRSKDKKGMKGADLKSINLLGSSYKEQVQPDMDELTANAEEPDEAEKPEIQKLGKLQFKVHETKYKLLK